MSDRFLWGAATAAYQIEGAAAEDGRTPSIWDTYSHEPGRVARGENGDVAADHYHLWAQDVDLMAELGLGAYRLSVSWSRVQPHGRGAFNPRGVDFYKRLVERLLSRGIKPFVTLYHWDLPQELQDAGGWPVRSTAEAFAEFADGVARALAAEGVKDWFTVNEPWCTAFLGYASGVHAPGVTDPGAALASAHHLNLAHTLGSRALHAVDPSARVGAALNMRAVYPVDPSNAEDIAAARELEVMGDEIFIGPMLEGAYSAEVRALTDHLVDWDALVQDGDLLADDERDNLVGVNYYYAVRAARRTESSPVGSSGGHGQSAHSPWVGCDDVFLPEPEPPHTAMGWSIDPEGLTKILLGLRDRFPGIEVAITENGIACDDVLDTDGAVHDPERIAYLTSHLQVLAEAREAGAEVTSYFQWSFMDNFEWARGYSKRFGLVHIDYETLARTPKDSAYWYAAIARSGLAPEELGGLLG